MQNTNQPTVRQINAHLASCSSYCCVYGTTYSFRISRARSRNGVVEGRIINGNWQDARSPKDWEVIPADAVVELT
jgi:hypothetical protein